MRWTRWKAALARSAHRMFEHRDPLLTAFATWTLLDGSRIPVERHVHWPLRMRYRTETPLLDTSAVVYGAFILNSVSNT